MIDFERYPHVADLLAHYAAALGAPGVQGILEAGVRNEEEAGRLARFVWQMAAQMGVDASQGKRVLGRVDNSDLLPDVDYEIGLYLDRLGYGEVWDKSVDEA